MKQSAIWSDQFVFRRGCLIDIQIISDLGGNKKGVRGDLELLS